MELAHPAAWRVRIRRINDCDSIPVLDSDANEAGAPWCAQRAAKLAAEGMLLPPLPPGSQLAVRTRRTGDRFSPAWRSNSNLNAKELKLARFLRDQGVPLHVRDRLPLVTLGGRVVAVYPLWLGAVEAGADGGARMRLVVETHSVM